MIAKGLLAGAAFAAAGLATWTLANQQEPGPSSGAEAAPAGAGPVRKGQGGIDQFLKAVRSRASDCEYFAVRTRLAARDGGLVPVWVDVHGSEGDVLIGSVGSSSAPLCGRRPGDPIRLRAALADDWMIVRKGRLQGGLTLGQR
jgi:hypothetical protein